MATEYDDAPGTPAKNRLVVVLAWDPWPGMKIRWDDRQTCNEFPGVCAFLALKMELERQGGRLLDAEHFSAISKPAEISTGKIHLLHIPFAQAAKKLEKEGAQKTVLLNWESPIVQPRFYDNFEKISQGYSNVIAFGGLKGRNQDGSKFIPARFPSFWRAEKPDLSSKLESAQKKFEGDRSENLAVMVQANKYWKQFGVMGKTGNALRQVAPWGARRRFQFRKKLQLHDLRIQVLSFFLEKQAITLFGQGWSDGPIPAQPSIARKIRESKPVPLPYSEKKITIASFKFGFAIENCTFPGYVTDKIIDLMVAGVIPIYLGAPDIKNFVPAECFVDMRSFSSHESLLDFLNVMPLSRYEEYLCAADEFLASPTGDLHSYEGFAKAVIQAIQ